MPRTKPVVLTARVTFKDNVAAEQLRALGRYLNDALNFLDKMDSSIQKARGEFNKIVAQMNKMEELFDLKIEQKKEEKKKDEKIVE